MTKRFSSLSQLIGSGAVAALAKEVSPNAAVLFIVLRHRQRGRDEFTVSRMDLAEQSGITERRVNNVLSELTKAGVLKIKGQGRGRLYTLVEPSTWAFKIDSPSASRNRLAGRGGRRSREKVLVCLETSEAMGLEGPDQKVTVEAWVARRRQYKGCDGHRCRSRGEQMVCNQLHHDGIDHLVEVPYEQLGIPPAFNKLGRRKPWSADIVIPKARIIIEVTGGYKNGNYQANLEAKRQAAMAAGWRVFFYGDAELEDLNKVVRDSDLSRLVRPERVTTSPLYSQGTPRPVEAVRAARTAGVPPQSSSGTPHGTPRPVAGLTGDAVGQSGADSLARQGTPRPVQPPHQPVASESVVRVIDPTLYNGVPRVRLVGGVHIDERAVNRSPALLVTSAIRPKQRPWRLVCGGRMPPPARASAPPLPAPYGRGRLRRLPA